MLRNLVALKLERNPLIIIMIFGMGKLPKAGLAFRRLVCVLRQHPHSKDDEEAYEAKCDVIKGKPWLG